MSSRNRTGRKKVKVPKGRQYDTKDMCLLGTKVHFKSETFLHKEEDVSFRWIIKNFNSFGGEEIRSESFHSPKSENQWVLKVQKVTDSEDGEDYLSMILEMVKTANCEFNKCQASIELSILGSNFIRKREIEKVKGDFMWKFPRFIEISELKEKSGYLNEGNLEVMCRVFTWIGLQHSKIETFGMPCKSEGTDRLLGMIKELLSTGDDSDVTITTLTKSFPVHKLILKIHSPVFKTMLESQMVEAANNVVSIVDFKEDAVAGMLSYMYTGKVDNMSECALEMLRISDKYDVPGLKSDAEVAVIQNLNVQNAADFLLHADLLNSTALKSKIVTFMKQYKKDIEKTEGFREVVTKHPMLLILF